MRIFRRAPTVLPAAFSVQPAGVFDEADGRWSTFNLQVGNPPQNFRAVVSTSSLDVWLPTPNGCPAVPQLPSDCPGSRGVGLYNSMPSSGYDGTASRSTTTTGQLSFQNVDLGEQLETGTLFGTNYTGNNSVGPLFRDYIGFNPPTNPINSSARAMIFGLQELQYYLPSIGIGVGRRYVDKIGTFNSSLTGMASVGTIPSQSWGYTAGAYYANGVLGRPASLVLGGYDKNRINGTVANFQFPNGTSSSRSLLISVPEISIQYHSGSPASSPGPLDTAIIDSTLPYLILPESHCDWLAKQLNLTYDDFSQLYKIDQATLQSNRQKIKTFTFGIAAGPQGLGNSPTGDSSVRIEFPYAAFDANASWAWFFEGPQAIFPLRKALPSAKSPKPTAVLGRAFLQEAYVIADYERNVFNVSQVAYGNNDMMQIVNLYNTTGAPHSSKKGLSGGAIGGIAAGGVVALLILLAVLLWFFVIKPRRRQPEETKAEEVKKDDYEMQKVDETGYTSRPRGQSTVSSNTAVSELGAEPASRPSHRRQVSELSSDSERDRRGTIGSMQYIPEVETEFHDAAELEGYMASNQQSPLSELEGEGHMMRSYGT